MRFSSFKISLSEFQQLKDKTMQNNTLNCVNSNATVETINKISKVGSSTLNNFGNYQEK